MMKAPLAQEAVGPNPTDRGKKGSTRHLLVDGRGVPLSLIVTGDDVHDAKGLAAVLDTIKVEREDPPLGRTSTCVLTLDIGVLEIEIRLRIMAIFRMWSIVTLNHLAAAIIAFRKVPLKINIIYG
jgi:hypothetical protein